MLLNRPLVFRAAMKELEDVVPDVSFRTELVEDWLALKLNPLSKIMKNSLKVSWTVTVSQMNVLTAENF